MYDGVAMAELIPAELTFLDPLPPQRRRVLVLAAAPAQLLDIAGPAEVLSQASRLHAVERGAHAESSIPPLYDVHLFIAGTGAGIGAGSGGGPNTSAGFLLGSTVTERALLTGPAFDTLIVAGGEGARRRAGDPSLQRTVRHVAAGARRVAGVCTGAFILAAAGLLNGRTVTTHWRWCADLARRHPGLRVDPDPIYVRDGNVWTSAGITAGMDLTLALVEEDHGHALALAVARELVLYLRRPGDQKQFSTVLSAQTGPGTRLGGLLAWMAGNLDQPLPVEALAARACLSPRQFARVFHEETGTTPARLVERLRVEAARRRLETGRAGLAAVAAACGFQTEETMRRCFLRQVGASPGEYRNRFRHAGTTPVTKEARP